MGPGRPAVLGSRRHRAARRRQDGQDDGRIPNQGAVLRSELDGSDFEVFATGMRNLQEFSFDERGNLISVDNDGDHPGENERLVYLPVRIGQRLAIELAVRQVHRPEEQPLQRLDGRGDVQAALRRARRRTSSPPIAPYHAGPSGMVYNPGTALSERGGTTSSSRASRARRPTRASTRSRSRPDGAGFAMDGRDASCSNGVLVVGMKIGPDGALYLTDWITGWESKNNGRLWKLDTPGGGGQRRSARKCRRCSRETSRERAPPTSRALLRHADMRVRQKAQFDLVRRGDVQALLAAARDARASAGARCTGSGASRSWRDKQPPTPPQLVAVPRGCRWRDPRAGREDARRRPLRAARRRARCRCSKDAAPRVRFFAAEALGRLAHRPAAPRSSRCSRPTTDRDAYLQHAGSLGPRVDRRRRRRSRRWRRTPRAACVSPPSSRCAACAMPASRGSSPTPTKRWSPKRPARSTTMASIAGAVPALAALLERHARHRRAAAAARHQREPPRRGRATPSRGWRRSRPMRRVPRSCASRRSGRSASGLIPRRWIAWMASTTVPSTRDDRRPEQRAS